MADKENKRKCFKCGCSPAKDNIKLFRFPKPAVRNLVRCELWAKYIFPEREASHTLQMKLHNEHRMLCQKHFTDADFTDKSKGKLLRTAVPYDTAFELPTYSAEPQAGPSQRVSFRDLSNVQSVPSVENTEPIAGTSNVQSVPSVENTEPIAGTSNVQSVPSVENTEPIAGTSNVQSVPSVENTEPIAGTSLQKEKPEKEKVLYAKCRKYLQKICQLRNRIKKLKTSKILQIISDDMAVKKISAKISPTFALLLQGQLRNYKKKVTGRRWTKEEKITSLRMFKRSPTCYRLLRRLFHLPAPTTLKTLLNRVPFNVGINHAVFEVMKKHIQLQKSSNNVYTLMFDEMSLKKHLQYNPKNDVIEGYQDHASQGRSPLIAAYALVFMVTGIRQRVKQPIAHFFSSGFSTADRLALLIKEVLHQCFEAGINIAAIVCDMDGVNRRALTILGASLQHPHIMVDNKEIITLFDPPHLLKCFRNLFMKYDIDCSTNVSSNNVIGRGIAKWSHVKEFYEADNNNPNFVYAPALKKEHLNPNTKQKMKVKLAAQVLSHSVSGGMYAKISAELTTDATVTANLINSMDKLFDTLNSDCSDLRRGKPHATNLRSNSPHLKCFEEMKKFFSIMKYIGSPRKPPSQEGWIWTLNAIERLWRNLVRSHNITSLATRRLQQDPLENLFGCIRGNCGSNTNPTCIQFVAGLKTAVLSNLSHIGTTGNCENDNNVIINNFEKMLSVSQPTCIYVEPEFTAINDLPQDMTEANEDSAEIQACAYVCGFILKKFPTTCENCRNALYAKQIERHHLFVEFQEYTEVKKSLNYVTIDMVTCVECCASLINKYLEENGHTPFIKKNIIGKIKTTINFDFLNLCMDHKFENIDNIVQTVFFISIKRFCIVKNRTFSEEASAAALRRKMNIVLHK